MLFSGEGSLTVLRYISKIGERNTTLKGGRGDILFFFSKIFFGPFFYYIFQKLHCVASVAVFILFIQPRGTRSRKSRVKNLFDTDFRTNTKSPISGLEILLFQSDLSSSNFKIFSNVSIPIKFSILFHCTNTSGVFFSYFCRNMAVFQNFMHWKFSSRIPLQIHLFQSECLCRDFNFTICTSSFSGKFLLMLVQQ